MLFLCKLGFQENKMGVGFRLTLKCGFSVPSHFKNNSPSRFSAPPVGGKETSINLTRLSFHSVSSEEGDTLYKDHLKAYAHSSAIQTLENDYTGTELSEVKKMNAGWGAKVSIEDNYFTADDSLKENGVSWFGLLLQNLETLEESFSDSDALKLERDILLQLGRLGALKLFNTCLSRTLKTNIFYLCNVPSENIGVSKVNVVDDHVEKIIIRTGKREERKSRRERAHTNDDSKSTSLPLPLKLTQNGQKKALSSKSRRLMITRNEAEMSRGIKMVSNLERIRTTLEKETGQVVSLSCWAEAAGLDEKVLMQCLRFGWYCRDELIKSTRSLVMFLAKNYRGMGITLEELLQAGSLGVLQGAERFDHAKGYRFSTYVQYWIRKSMLKILSLHAKGITIPCTLNKAMNQIKKARKVLSYSHGKHPDDFEISEFTGLSLDKIELASKCPRIVGSVDQKMDGFNAKYLEFIPDMSIQSPEEVVLMQHMIKDIHNLLQSLDSRERQVLILRYGLEDHQPKSLEEIGRLLCVSKEWVRRIEKKVITRLRDEETCRNLRYYVNS